MSKSEKWRGDKSLPTSKDVQALLILRLNVWPAAMTQQLALGIECALYEQPEYVEEKKEIVIGSLKTATGMYQKPPYKYQMMQQVETVNTLTRQLLGDDGKHNFFQQPLLPKSEIPVIYPFDAFSWTSAMQYARLGMVSSILRHFNDIGVDAKAYDGYIAAEKKYFEELNRNMKNMASAIRYNHTG